MVSACCPGRTTIDVQSRSETNSGEFSCKLLTKFTSVTGPSICNSCERIEHHLKIVKLYLCVCVCVLRATIHQSRSTNRGKNRL